MAGDRGKRGGGLNRSMIWRIVMAWLVTVPVTIAIAAVSVESGLLPRPPLTDGWFADSPLEESGFELAVPSERSVAKQEAAPLCRLPRCWERRGRGPWTCSKRVDSETASGRQPALTKSVIQGSLASSSH
jgi:hypothetical protein